MNLLVTKNVKVCYDKQLIIHGIDFELEPGEIKGIMGPNGAGKSTFLRTLSGELEPSAGEIYFNGRNLTGEAARVVNRTGISYLPQRPGCFTSLTIRENLQGAAQRDYIFSRRHAETVSNLVELLGFDDNLDLPAGDLSYGEMRVLDLAMALICKPKVLLADEPTAGVSSDTADEIVDLLKLLCDDGYNGEFALQGLIVVEHEKYAAFQMANKIDFFRAGNLVVEDSPSSIAKYPEVAQYLSEHEFE